MKKITLGLLCLLVMSFAIFAIESKMSFADGNDGVLSEVEMYYDATCLNTSGTNYDLACWNWSAQEKDAEGKVVAGASQNMYILQNNKTMLIHQSLPFFSGVSSTDACQNKLFYKPKNKIKQFRRSKGWRVFHREFGTPSTAETTPHFSLYNIYSGEYMFFAYIPQNTMKEGYSHGLLRVKLNNDRHIFARNPSKPLTTPLEKFNLLSIGDIRDGSWFCAKFLFDGYDPIPRDKGIATKMEWKLFAVNVAKLKSDAKFKTDDDGEKTIKETTFTDEPLKAVSSAYKQYKSMDDSLEAAKKWLDERVKSKTKGDNSKKLIQRLNASGTSDGDTWKKVRALVDSSVASYLPLAAAIGEFLFWNSESPETPVMALSGGFDLNGKITEKDTISSDGFSLPMTGEDSAYSTKVLYKKRLGIFNIWNKPEVEYIVTEHFSECGADRNGDVRYTHTVDNIYYRLLNNTLQYTVNPDAGVYVKKIEAGLSTQIDKQSEDKKVAIVYPLDIIQNYWQKTEPLNKYRGCDSFTKINVYNSKHSGTWKEYLGIPTELRISVTIAPLDNPNHEINFVRTIPIDPIEKKLPSLGIDSYLEGAKHMYNQEITLIRQIQRNEIVAPEITIPDGISLSKIPKPGRSVHLQGIKSIKITGGNITVKQGQTIKLSIPDPAGDAYFCADCKRNDS